MLDYILSNENQVNWVTRGRSAEPSAAERVFSTPELLQQLNYELAFSYEGDGVRLVMCGVAGSRGTGKSRLLREVGEVVKNCLPSRLLMFEDPYDMEELLRSLLDQLGVDSTEFPVGTSQSTLATMAQTALRAASDHGSIVIIVDATELIGEPDIPLFTAFICQRGIRSIVAVRKGTPQHEELKARAANGLVLLTDEVSKADGAHIVKSNWKGVPKDVVDRLLSASTNPGWLMAAASEMQSQGWHNAEALDMVSPPTKWLGTPVPSVDYLHALSFDRLIQSGRYDDIEVRLVMQCLGVARGGFSVKELASLPEVVASQSESADDDTLSAAEAANARLDRFAEPSPQALEQTRRLLADVDLKPARRGSVDRQEPLLKKELRDAAFYEMVRDSLDSNRRLVKVHLALADLCCRRRPVDTVTNPVKKDAKSCPAFCVARASLLLPAESHLHNALTDARMDEDVFGGRRMTNAASTVALCHHLYKLLDHAKDELWDHGTSAERAKVTGWVDRFFTALSDWNALDVFLQPARWCHLRGLLKRLVEFCMGEGVSSVETANLRRGESQMWLRFCGALGVTLTAQSKRVANMSSSAKAERRANEMVLMRRRTDAAAFLSWAGRFREAKEHLTAAEKRVDAIQPLFESQLEQPLLEESHALIQLELAKLGERQINATRRWTAAEVPAWTETSKKAVDLMNSVVKRHAKQQRPHERPPEPSDTREEWQEEMLPPTLSGSLTLARLRLCTAITAYASALNKAAVVAEKEGKAHATLDIAQRLLIDGQNVVGWLNYSREAGMLSIVGAEHIFFRGRLMAWPGRGPNLPRPDGRNRLKVMVEQMEEAVSMLNHAFGPVQHTTGTKNDTCAFMMTILYEIDLKHSQHITDGSGADRIKRMLKGVCNLCEAIGIAVEHHWITHPFVQCRVDELADHLDALSAVVSELSALVPVARVLRSRSDARFIRVAIENAKERFEEMFPPIQTIDPDWVPPEGQPDPGSF